MGRGLVHEDRHNWEECRLEKGHLVCEIVPRETEELSYFDYQVEEDGQKRRIITSSRPKTADLKSKIEMLMPATLSEIKHIELVEEEV